MKLSTHLNSTKLIVFDMPAFTANADSAPEYIRRIKLSFDRKKTSVVVAPKCLLPFWLVHITLEACQ